MVALMARDHINDPANTVEVELTTTESRKITVHSVTLRPLAWRVNRFGSTSLPLFIRSVQTVASPKGPLAQSFTVASPSASLPCRVSESIREDLLTPKSNVIPERLIPREEPMVDVCFRPEALVYLNILAIRIVHQLKDIVVVIHIIGITKLRK